MYIYVKFEQITKITIRNIPKIQVVITNKEREKSVDWLFNLRIYYDCTTGANVIFDCVNALLQVYCMPYPDVPGDGSIIDVFHVVVVGVILISLLTFS